MAPSDPAARSRGRNNKARGSQVEREVARLLTAIMQAEIGDYPQHQPFAWRLWAAARAQADVETKGIGDLPVPSVPHWAFGSVVEVKSTKAGTPKRRLKAWQQATQAAEETGKRPLVVETYVDGGKRTYWLVQKLDWPDEESN